MFVLTGALLLLLIFMSHEIFQDVQRSAQKSERSILQKKKKLITHIFCERKIPSLVTSVASTFN